MKFLFLSVSILISCIFTRICSFYLSCEMYWLFIIFKIIQVYIVYFLFLILVIHQFTTVCKNQFLSLLICSMFMSYFIDICCLYFPASLCFEFHYCSFSSILRCSTFCFVLVFFFGSFTIIYLSGFLCIILKILENFSYWKV